MHRISIIFICFLSPVLIRAQWLPEWQRTVEWSDNESIAEDLLEMQEDMIATFAPFNLNDTLDLQRMWEAELISMESLQRMKAHLLRYGPLLHPYELYHCSIFSAEWLKGMEPLLSYAALNSKSGPREGLHALRGESRTRFGLNGNDSPVSLRQVLRFSGRIGRKTDMALVYAKGAGESFLARASPWEVEHISGFVRWRNNGLLRQLIIGDFQFQGGMGLRYGKGWASSDARFPLAEATLPARLVARTSSLANTTLKGMAAEWRKGAARLNISSGAQYSDGFYQGSADSPDWSEGGGGDHSTPRNAARRAQASLQRHSLRLGMEKEWMRLGLSLDRLQSAGMNPEEGKTLFLAAEGLGIDVQWVARHQEFWLEGVRFRQAKGIAFSWVNGQNDWISFRMGGSFREGSLPFSSGQSSLADAPELAQADLYAAASLAWGRGWSLRGGLRNEQSWMRAGEMILESRVYAKAERSVFGKANHSLLADIRLPSQSGAEDPEAGIQRFRIMYRVSILSGPDLQWSAGGHLAGERNPLEEEGIGLAWYLASRYLRPGKKFCALDAAIAWHQLDNASTRAWFWFVGSEGRMLLQSLNGQGGRASLSGCWQWSEKCKATAGLSFRRSVNTAGEASASLELGVRLQYQW